MDDRMMLLKAYICKTKSDRRIIGLAGFIFAIAGVGCLKKDVSILLTIVMFLCAAVLLREAFGGKGREAKEMRALTKRPDAEALLSDFSEAQSFADDAVRLGAKYIFRKKYPVILTYDDIVSAEYFDRYSIQDNTTERGIRIKLTSGRYETLCDLYGIFNQAEIEGIYAHMKACNPNIETKY